MVIDCMTTSEAATERAITFSIKIGYWNVGLQESTIECDARENHLRKLRDVAELWVKHELHALCLCEVGSHSTGFHNEHNHKVVEERICGYIRELHKEWVNTKRIRKRHVEPTLRTYWNNNYMMVCDEQCLRVEHVPKAVYIRPDEYHHYTAVVLRRLSSDGTQQSPRVLAVNASVPRSEISKLTDAMRRQMISNILEYATEQTDGRLIIGGDLNTDHATIQRLFGSAHLHIVTSKPIVRKQGDYAGVSGMRAIQRQSGVGRTFQGADSASDEHDAVVVDAHFLPGEAGTEQAEARSSITDRTFDLVAAIRCLLAT